MTPEERKAIAMRQDTPDWWVECPSVCEERYPRCCAYHEGFDDALGLLVPNATWHPSRSGGTLHWPGERCEVDHGDIRTLYIIEAP